MRADTFRRSVAAFAFEDVIVFEMHSGGRVIAFHRELLTISNGWCHYIEDDGTSNFFDATAVSRVMGQPSLPGQDDPPYPSRNGSV